MITRVLVVYFLLSLGSCRSHQQTGAVLQEDTSRLLVLLADDAKLEDIEWPKELDWEHAKRTSRHQNLWQMSWVSSDTDFEQVKTLLLQDHRIIKVTHSQAENLDAPSNHTNSKSGKSSPIEKN